MAMLTICAYNHVCSQAVPIGKECEFEEYALVFPHKLVLIV